MDKREIYEDYIKTLSNSKGAINGLLCYSRAGLGKTYTTIQILKNNGLEYLYVSGVTTAVAFYKIIVNHSDKIIVFDDIETMFQNENIINLLKACLWEVDGKREVSYKTTSPLLNGYPEKIIFEGKIIILMNEIKGKYDESFKALMSRMLKYELKYTFEEVKNISLEILDEKNIDIKTKNKVKEYILTNIKPEQDFNFRLLERLVAFYQYNDEKAQLLFEESIDIDHNKKIMIEIIKNNKIVKEQVEKYYELTGKSRMTFFRNKKKLEQEGLL